MLAHLKGAPHLSQQQRLRDKEVVQYNLAYVLPLASHSSVYSEVHILNSSIERYEPGLVVLGSMMSSGWITQRCSTVTGVPVCQAQNIIRNYLIV